MITVVDISCENISLLKEESINLGGLLIIGLYNIFFVISLIITFKELY